MLEGAEELRKKSGGGLSKSEKESAWKKAKDVYNGIREFYTPDSSDKTLAYRTRTGKQTALILSLEKLLKAIPNGETISRENKQYGLFSKTKLDGSDSIELSKNLFKNDALMEKFNAIPTNLLSHLLPSIELYKTIYSIPIEDSRAATTEDEYFKKSYDWRIPFDDMSTAYENYTSEYVKDSIDEIMRGDGRLHGVGIKSFSYRFAGSNPAEVNSSIEAELELYFQNVEDVVKELVINDKNDPRFGAFKPQEDINTIFSYSQLVNIEPRLLKNSKPNTKYYEIKAVIGYAKILEDEIKKIFPEANDEEIRKTKKAINSAKVILHLVPHNSNLTFEDNGAVTLKINYIASLDVLMQELDIFNSGYRQNLEKKINGYESRVREQKTKLDRIKSNKCLNQTTKAAQEKEVQDELEKIEKDKNLVDAGVYAEYQEFYKNVVLKSLYQVDYNIGAIGADPGFNKVFQDSNDAATTRIDYFARNNTTNVFQNYKKLIGLEGDELLPDVKLYDENFYGSNPVGRAVTSLAAKANNLIDQGQATTYVDSATVVSNAINGKSLQQLGLDDKNKTYKVKFVFFGDLLQEMLRQAYGLKYSGGKISVDRGGLNIILGELPLKIPTDTLYNFKEIVINLADMPVALDFLEIFFFEKIIKPRRTRYPIAQFIRDFIVEMIIPAISPIVFGRNAFSDGSTNAARISNVSFSLPYNINGTLLEEIISKSIVLEKNFVAFDAIIDKTKLDEIRAITDNLPEFDSASRAPAADYFYVYCSSELPKFMISNKGDYEKDKQSGILHFLIGTDSSIIKKINFSRNETPFYKEMRATNEGNVNLTILKETYDCDIEMFGNNIFRIGDFIYIEPLFFQGQKAIEIQSQLGLGGYYQVLEVKTVINDNIFSTSVRAVLQGHIEKKGSETVVIGANNIGAGC